MSLFVSSAGPHGYAPHRVCKGARVQGRNAAAPAAKSPIRATAGVGLARSSGNEVTGVFVHTCAGHTEGATRELANVYWPKRECWCVAIFVFSKGPGLQSLHFKCEIT